MKRERTLRIPAGGRSVLRTAEDRVMSGLAPVFEQLADGGMPVPSWRGKLIRPVVGLAASGGLPPEPARLWQALASVQLAHEASLLHDDVIDGAASRRGEPTVAALQGVGVAVVEGDHLLTASYRLAAGTGNLEWVDLFARAVERTVAGEKAQASAAGRALSWSEYEEIVLAKSGELLGAAMAAGTVFRGGGEAARYRSVGRRIGLVYQMLDDLLDYCPGVETGKPALGDHARGLWTWPRAYVDLPPGLDRVEVERRLREPDATGITPLERCLSRLRAMVDQVSEEVSELLPGDPVIPALLDEWLERAERAVAPRGGGEGLPPVGGWESLMSKHAKSFRFATRLFPEERREQVMGVYAWCRYTDDLVDGVELPAAELEARLDAWLALSRRAYLASDTGNDLADRVMGQMRAAGVPFGYAEELIEGMRMDVRRVQYGTMTELGRYTYRVASVVGLWVTELFGIRDPWFLDRAASLGHAMQLTNILRDVGEDVRAGRVYLPATWLKAHGLGREDLERMAAGEPVTSSYRKLVERLLRVAEAEYDHAAPAIALLPDFYRRPVAVAADVYRGIHGGIRRNDYDNIRLRAHTSLPCKLLLGAGALWKSRAPTVRASGRSQAALFGLLLCLVPPGLEAQSVPSASLPVADPVTLEARALPVPDASATDRAMHGIRALWLLGVEDGAAVDAGLEAVRAVRERFAPLPAARERLLRSYEGAFLLLRAKHGRWPPSRLRNLRDGLHHLDAVVQDAPDAIEPRYIRLTSAFHLPGVFGRRDQVEADIAALVRLVPEGPEAIADTLLHDVVAFLLDHGNLAPGQRGRLETLRP